MRAVSESEEGTDLKPHRKSRSYAGAGRSRVRSMDVVAADYYEKDKAFEKQHRDSKWLSQQDRAGIIFSALQQLEARNTRYRNSPDLVETSELFVNVRIAITGEWANLYRPHLPSTIANVKVPREC